MDVAILSRREDLYSTRRLGEACHRAGLEGRVLDPFRFGLLCRDGEIHLQYDGEPLPPLGAIIPRVGAGTNASGIAVVRHLEEGGVYSLNGSEAISRCRDKFRCMQLLSSREIYVPPTALTLRQEDVLPAVRRVGGVPVILKVLESTRGSGIFLAESEEVAESTVLALHECRRYVLIQKFVQECRGRDLRAFVVGEEVVAAVRRTAAPGEFRCNVHLGGRAETARLPEEIERTAVEASRALGLEVAGVDLLETRAGPAVLEVNASPGLEGIESVTGVDVAGMVVDHMVQARKKWVPVSA